MIYWEKHSYSSYTWWGVVLIFILLLSACLPQETAVTKSTTPIPTSTQTPIPPTSTAAPTQTATPSPAPTQTETTSIQIEKEDNALISEPLLFSEITEPITTPLDSPTIMRARLVEVNFDVLGDENGPPHDGSGTGEIVILNLFPDTNFIAILDRVENNSSSSYTWIGHLEGLENSQVTLVVNQAIMIGKITTPTEIYEINHMDNYSHRIIQIDQAAFPEELEPIPVP